MNDLQLNIDNYGLTENRAEQIKNLYSPMINSLETMEKEFNEVVAMKVTDESIVKSRDLRLRISKVRTSADKARKDAKEDYLLVNKAIQGAFNALEFATKGKEEKLLAIEKHHENKEKERIEILQETRYKSLLKYTENPDLIPTNLGIMEDEVWENYLTGSKTNYQTRIDAEKKAEEDKQKAIEKADVYRSRKDQLAPYTFLISINGLTLDTPEDQFKALLKKGQDAKKVDDKIKSDAIKAEAKLKKEAEEKEKLEFKRSEARGKQLMNEFKMKPSGHGFTIENVYTVLEHQIKTLDDNQWKEILNNITESKKNFEQSEINRKASEKATAELKAKKDADAKIEADRLANVEKEAKKGDEAKYKDLISDLQALKTKYEFKSKANKQKYEGLGSLIDKSVAYLKI